MLIPDKPKLPSKPSLHKYKEVKKRKINHVSLRLSFLLFILGGISFYLLFKTADTFESIHFFVSAVNLSIIIGGLYLFVKSFYYINVTIQVEKTKEEKAQDSKIYDKSLAEYELNLKFYNGWLEQQRKKKEEEELRTTLEKAAKKRQEDAERKKQADAKKRDEEAKKWQEELNYESVFVLSIYLDKSGKKRFVFRKSNNTFCDIEFNIENVIPLTHIKLLKETINNWTWISDKELKASNDKNKDNIEIKKQQSQLLNKYGVEFFYHMTHKNNLENILRNGLHSHNHARNNGLTKVDIADNQVNDRRAKLEPVYSRSIHDYVPLYFNPKNPMLYRRRELQKDIVILAIDRHIIFQENTLFTNGNAAAGATIFYRNTDDLRHLNWDCLDAEFWNDIPDGKRIKCAEVLVYPTIPTSEIHKIYCNNESTKNFIKSRVNNIQHLEVEINPDLYFSSVRKQSFYGHSSYDDLPF